MHPVGLQMPWIDCCGAWMGMVFLWSDLLDRQSAVHDTQTVIEEKVIRSDFRAN